MGWKGPSMADAPEAVKQSLAIRLRPGKLAVIGKPARQKGLAGPSRFSTKARPTPAFSRGLRGSKIPSSQPLCLDRSIAHVPQLPVEIW